MGMKNYRLGNTITIKWTIMTATGTAYNLNANNLELYAVVPNYAMKVDGFSVAGNVITWTFRGTDQKFTGPYTLTLIENRGQSTMMTVDYCNAFGLVRWSCQAGWDESADVNSNLSITSEIFTHQIALSKEVQDAINETVTEYNVSNRFPTGGIDGSNRYTLENAIAKIPESLRSVGIKCSFISDAGEFETWEYNGTQWIQIGGRAVSEIETLLEEGYIFAGIATPSTNPETQNNNVFYIAISPGTYVNFNNYVVNDYNLTIFYNRDGSWQAITLASYSNEFGISTSTSVSQYFVSKYLNLVGGGARCIYYTPSAINPIKFENQVITISWTDLSIYNTSNHTIYSNRNNSVVNLQVNIPRSAGDCIVYANIEQVYKLKLHYYTLSGIVPSETTDDYLVPENGSNIIVLGQLTYRENSPVYDDYLKLSSGFTSPISIFDNINSIKNSINSIESLTTPKLKLLPLSFSNSGNYVEPMSGKYIPNTDYSATDNIPVTGGTTYVFSGFGNTYGAWYDSNGTYINDGGIQVDEINQTNIFKSPANAAYLKISTMNSYLSSASIANQVSLYPNIFVDASQVNQLEDNTKEIIDKETADIVRYNTVSVDPNGGRDFTRLLDAINFVNDKADYHNRYYIDFYGDGSEYNLLNDAPFNPDLPLSIPRYGLFIPNFCCLRGRTGREKCIFVARLPDFDDYYAPINLYGESSMEDVTIIGAKTRYVVHDDFITGYGDINTDYERVIKNCRFVSESTTYKKVYGAGNRSGHKWRFENCVFQSQEADTMSYTCHNNVNFTEPTYQTFVNCRFESADQQNKISVGFGTLNNNANNVMNYVYLYGCKAQYLSLYEENVSLYGAGILFKVSGYGNNLKTGSEDISIKNTDGKDYSSLIDLI